MQLDLKITANLIATVQIIWEQYLNFNGIWKTSENTLKYGIVFVLNLFNKIGASLLSIRLNRGRFIETSIILSVIDSSIRSTFVRAEKSNKLEWAFWKPVVCEVDAAVPVVAVLADST